ncbi:DUF1273 domain-containing protein [uncultured Limosilactobacillus sp.]|uniref:DUF1273 domain-containing protein n=1 Tax=uncultured Limosilactobacillus sp. TaxID=2837629 RepID=UPI0025EABED6|nr:DUF1273 domain-containing protein [uncultured Limosilactobacillus sp.]
MYRVWLTGYRAYELGVFQDNDPKIKVIKNVLKNALIDRLNNHSDQFWVISGPQMGVERWGLEVAQSLKKQYPQLKTSIMEPYAQVAARWKEENQEKLAVALNQVDFHALVSNQPYHSPQQLRNYQDFMLKHTDELLTVFDVDRETESEQTSKPFWDYQAAIKFQQKHNYEVMTIDFDELQDKAQELAEQASADY